MKDSKAPTIRNCVRILRAVLSNRTLPMLVANRSQEAATMVAKVGMIITPETMA